MRKREIPCVLERQGNWANAPDIGVDFQGSISRRFCGFAPPKGKRFGGRPASGLVPEKAVRRATRDLRARAEASCRSLRATAGVSGKRPCVVRRTNPDIMTRPVDRSPLRDDHVWQGMGERGMGTGPRCRPGTANGIKGDRMMSRKIGVLFVVGLSVSNAWGASVAFDQVSVTLYNDPALGNTTATLEVSLETAVEPDLVSFTTFGLLLGSTVADLRITDFVFSPGFEDLWAGGLLVVDVPGPGLYESDAFAEGFRFSGEAALPTIIGAVTIDAEGVTPGDYPQAIVVDGTSLIDDGRSVLQDAALVSEALVGFARIIVVDDSTMDTDGDGVVDNVDVFPNDPTETTDTDEDGVGDNADTDDDGDEVSDNEDDFPLDPTETTDTDGDGVGDNADAFPDDPTATTDGDGDGSNGAPPARGRLCGVAMVGSFALMMLGLFTLRLSYGRSGRGREDCRAG